MSLFLTLLEVGVAHVVKEGVAEVKKAEVGVAEVKKAEVEKAEVGVAEVKKVVGVADMD